MLPYTFNYKSIDVSAYKHYSDLYIFVSSALAALFLLSFYSVSTHNTNHFPFFPKIICWSSTRSAKLFWLILFSLTFT